jgi:MYXO-CTERM domain-containing protein
MFMRKAIAAVSATGALLFGGAGVANAAVQSAPVPSVTTTVAQQDNSQNNQKSDHSGLWGLVGLLGLGGLAGLMRRKETATGAGVAGPGSRGQTPRA